MYIESVPRMSNVGVSNIVSDRENNILFYTSSWADGGSYMAKMCRVFYPQSRHPAQECTSIAKLYGFYLSPLALNTKANILITTVSQNVPAAFNATTFEMIWSDPEMMGSDPTADYKNDPFTGDVYWIGGDDSMRKMNSTGTRLFENDTNSGGNRDFALDSRHQKVVRAWQDLSDREWPLIVSAWDVGSTELREQWQWKNTMINSTNNDCTPPVIDDQYGRTYFVNLPYAIALDTDSGYHKWQTQVVTESEINELDLVSECIAFNGQTRIIYFLGKSTKISSTLFLVAVHADTGKILRRMEVLQKAPNAEEYKKLTIPFCPVLIGNELIYVSWLSGDYPELVPLTVVGVPQLS
jgi:outer membrane protein assembly factor BamB